MKKRLAYANIFWLILFLFDSDFALFQVSNAQYLTFMGLYIRNID
ncbi:hypothetical protein STPE111643_01830 [Streptococcus penaeicida]